VHNIPFMVNCFMS